MDDKKRKVAYFYDGANSITISMLGHGSLTEFLFEIRTQIIKNSRCVYFCSRLCWHVLWR